MRQSWAFVMAALAILALLPVLPPPGAGTRSEAQNMAAVASLERLLVEDTFYATMGIELNDRLIPLEADTDIQPIRLAPGVEIDSAGRLVGSPRRPGTFAAPVRLCRVDECAHQRVTVVVLRYVPWEPRDLTFPGRVGIRIDGEISVNGGPSGIPPTYTVTDAGALPPGVAIGPDGHVGGVPTSAGMFQVPVRVCLAGNCAGVVVRLMIA